LPADIGIPAIPFALINAEENPPGPAPLTVGLDRNEATADSVQNSLSRIPAALGVNEFEVFHGSLRGSVEPPATAVEIPNRLNCGVASRNS
jgi:hypothetical protein